MKKILLIISVTFLVINTKATKVYIHLNEWAIYKVIISKQHQTASADHFVFNNIAPGNQHIKIFKIYKRDPGKIGSGFSPPPTLIYSAYIDIPTYGSVSIQINDKNSITPILKTPITKPKKANSNFYVLKDYMEAEKNDRKKLQIALDEVNYYSFSSAQIKELMLLLAFDVNKYELAKCAYKNCFNKTKYYIVNSAFTFDSYANKLNSFIESNYY